MDPEKTALSSWPDHPVLKTQAERAYKKIIETARQKHLPLPDADCLRKLASVACCSPFLGRLMHVHLGSVFEMMAGEHWGESLVPAAYAKRLQLDDALLAGDEHTFMAELRRLRQREMLYLGIRDLVGIATIEETLLGLSMLADECICLSEKKGFADISRMYGIPMDKSGCVQRLIVVGMGKLGGRELNYSSDVDLIFFYPDAGDTQCTLANQRSLDHQTFFTRVGQRIIKYLHEVTAEGFVFRVDMRLRPEGDAGPLVMSFDALERYYQSQGRDWERYAFIKARAITGNHQDIQKLQSILRPFVYRRYLDYGAFDALREMKALIEREEKRKGLRENIKLGAGGIREIEFIGQAFQLIRGGREAAFRQREILRILEVMGKRGVLGIEHIDVLIRAYRFLRATENCLQRIADQQVHHLPVESVEQARVAYALGFDGWSDFKQQLDHHRGGVKSCFAEIFAYDKEPGGAVPGITLDDIWAGLEDEEAAAKLKMMGITEAVFLLAELKKLRDSHTVRHMSRRARERLDQFIPMFIASVAQTAVGNAAISRMMDFIQAIGRRSVYLSLLLEYPLVLNRVIEFFTTSSWLAGYLIRHPLLLDTLIDSQHFYELPELEGMREQCTTMLASVEADDLEAQMDILRQFKHEMVFRIAAADINSNLPLMRVSDYLTALAETVLEAVYAMTWKSMTARYGRPRYYSDGEKCDVQFAIIGYGKLGGIELGYGSDLDVIFLHDSEGETQRTDGAQHLDNTTFFVRLARKILHILNVHTVNAVLYDVDIRLRPDGASGLLVSSIGGFERYQSEAAWTWEHQALVRARVVVGNPHIRAAFEAVRTRILCQPRDLKALRQDVLEMRNKMRKELSCSGDGEFDLKQDSGGVVDIEFMVQYMVLGYAHRYRELTRYTDNIRLLELCANVHVIDTETASLLMEAYRQLRARLHRQALLNMPAVIKDSEELCIYRAVVDKAWRKLFEC